MSMSYKELQDSRRASRVRKIIFVGAFGLGAVSSAAFLHLVSPDRLFCSGKEPEISYHLESGGNFECGPSDLGCADGMPPADTLGSLSGHHLDLAPASPSAKSGDNQPASTLASKSSDPFPTQSIPDSGALGTPAAKPSDPFPTQSIPDGGAEAPIATRSPAKTFAKSVKPKVKLAKSAASNYCHSLGGRIERRNGLHGHYGLCQLPNGSAMEEWRFYRMEHSEN
jgi:putative hemolysin